MNKASAMELSIIIPTRDRLAIAERTIATALAASESMDAEVIVVNDSPDTVPLLPASSRVRLIAHPGHGPAIARNRGAAEAHGRLLLFLDNDILITRESLEATCALHRVHQHAAMNPDWTYPPELEVLLAKTRFGRFLAWNKETSHRAWTGEASWETGVARPSGSVASFHLSITREDFTAIGGYCTEPGFELLGDYSMPKRLSAHGIAMFFHGGIHVLHNEADRLDMRSWSDNWVVRGDRMRRGQLLGLVNDARKAGPLKRLAARMIFASRGLWFGLVRALPEARVLDAPAFQLLRAVQMASIQQALLRT